MQLWNDYEGKTIAEAYPLTKLLFPEGRSAFFVTTQPGGTPDIIRVTESLNDEQEMLERWRQVAGVDQANLIEIKKFGSTTIDGIPLTYALMEPSDGNLADILKERPLTTSETTEVAVSVVAALSALHAGSLIHEHVEPANILAAGEVIKLRSDCVRECIPDPEFHPAALCAELRQRDVHDLAVLLLRCLTLEKKLSPGVKFPAPFDQIIPRGIDGTWGLPEIAAALKATAIKTLVPQSVLSQARPLSDLPSTPQAAAPPTSSTPSPALKLRRVQAPFVARTAFPRRWIPIAVAAVALLLLLWHFVGGKPVAPAVAAPAVASTPKRTPPPASAILAAHPPVAPIVQAEPTLALPVSGQRGWRVVAYTYNHEGQAQHKASTLLTKYPAMRPEVFSPTGRAPFLVTLGGVMSKTQARTLRDQARRAHLPKDTFARVYEAR